MKTVLVFGYRGFSGGYFLDFAGRAGLGLGYSFIGADLSSPTGAPSPAGSGAVMQLDRREVDCLDAEAVKTLIVDTNPTYVINLIGLFGKRSLAEFLKVNVTVSKNILDACLAAPQRAEKILLIGSAAEYGIGYNNPISETAIPHPANDHGYSKFMQTCLASHYQRCFSLPVVVGRTFNITGRGASPELAVGRFETEIAAAKDGDSILTGDLSNRRDYLEASEVASRYWRLLRHGIPGEVYNVCSGHSVAVGELLDAMIRESGKRLSVVRDPAFSKQGDISDIYGDPSKLESLPLAEAEGRSR